MSEFVLAKKTDMVALADALRELSGGTEELAFPGGMVDIAEDTDTAVEAALAALTEKGVDTAGAGLVDIAGLIAAIEAGGAIFEVGSYTPTSDQTGALIYHSLGVRPNVLLCWMNGYLQTYPYLACGLGTYGIGADCNVSVYTASASYSGHVCIPTATNNVSIISSYTWSYSVFYDATDDRFRIGGNNYKLKAGAEYKWVAIGGLA